MRSILIGVALFGAVPAVASASDFHPELGSFAHQVSHSSPVYEFDYPPVLPEPVKPPSESTPAPTTASAPGVPPGTPVFTRRELCSTVAFEAAINKIPVRFFANLIEQESSFRLHVISHAGAQGIAQFMPQTAAERGLLDPFEPMQALSASARLLSDLRERFGNLGLAAAAYNAGPQRVTDWLAKQGGLPAETQHYVRRITGIPAEEWARSDKAQEISLPPYADCPQLRMASADSLVSTKMSPSEGRVYPRLTGKAAARYARAAKYAWYRGSALKYVSLSPSAAHSSPNEFTKSVHAAVGRVRVANSSK